VLASKKYSFANYLDSIVMFVMAVDSTALNGDCLVYYEFMFTTKLG
jgi:hypothetical protein|tara:strand:- start:275 stop:412 length:138 start_codon:yes stop_codon:yes gene_type:complete